MEISELNLPAPADKFCRMACIETVEELIKLSEAQISKYRFGKPAIASIRTALKKLGLELGMRSAEEYLREAAELEEKGKPLLSKARKLKKLAANIQRLG